jgi:hypothetical protein
VLSFWCFSWWQSFIRHLKSDAEFKPQAIPFDKLHDTPRFVDWRPQLRANAVKDQTKTSSFDTSFAFATNFVIEAHHFIRTGRNLSLSEQEIVDCSECLEGSTSKAFSYVIQHGISLSQSYNSTPGKCRRKEAPRSEVKVFGFAEVRGKENFKKALSLFGPIAVKVKSSPKTFVFYKEGIYDDQECKTANFDQEAAIVGFGFNHKLNLDFFIIRNSWSKYWGENGYMRVAVSDDGSSCVDFDVGYFPLLDESTRDGNETEGSPWKMVLLGGILVVLTVSCCSYVWVEWVKLYRKGRNKDSQ